jgi:hypothetical protein
MCLLLLVGAVACQEKSSTTSTGSSSNDYSTGGTTGSTTAGSTTGTTTGSTTGSSTSGSTTGSTSGSTGGTTGSTANVFKFNVTMSGLQNAWYPGFYPSDYSSSAHAGDFYQISSGNSFVFKSDARFRARVLVKAEPGISSTDNNRAVCYKRDFPFSQNSQTHPYQKLSFNVSLRDIVYNNGSYSIGNRYATKEVEPSGAIGVNYVSPIFDWSSGQFPGRTPATGNDDSTEGPLANGVIGQVVEVHDVKSNAYCIQTPGYAAYCPTATHPNTRCWKLELQLATDSTQNF